MLYIFRRTIVRGLAALALVVGIGAALAAPVAAAPDPYKGMMTIDPGVDASAGAAPLHLPGTAQSTAQGLDNTDLVDGGDPTVNDVNADTSLPPAPQIFYFASTLNPASR